MIFFQRKEASSVTLNSALANYIFYEQVTICMVFFQEHSFCYVQMNFYNGIVFHLALSNASVRGRTLLEKLPPPC